MSAPRAPGPPATPEHLLDAGLDRHRAGDLAGAARCYQQALQRAPGLAEAWHLLGLVHAQAGDAANAQALIGRALAIDPHHAEAHYNLANLHRQTARPDEAVASYRAALAADPAMAKAWSNLGATLRGAGDVAGAIDACRQAIAHDPGRIEAHYNLGCALQHDGQLDEAVGAYRATLARAPRHGDALGNCGLALMQLDRAAEALPLLQAAARFAGDAPAHIALSACLTRLGAFDAALSSAQAATALAPDHASTWLQLGHALRELGQTVPAMDAYLRARACEPRSADIMVAQAIAAQEAGARDQAARFVAEALAIDPRHVQAWTVHAGLKRFAPGDPDIAALGTLVQSLDEGTDRTHAEFALARARLDCAEPDAAFALLNRANARHRATRRYDVARDLAAMTALAEAFDGPIVSSGDRTMRPIFIVGMPRSGTTLVEQICASHPAIHGGGEMKHLDLVLLEQFGTIDNRAGDPADAAWRLAGLSGAKLAGLARAYHRRATAGIDPAQRVTDKMPSNFRHIGLIARMFPAATIVHCRRDPRDTCLSIYATHFAQGQDFAYDLAELGAYYRGYQALMAHWRTVVPPGMMIEIDYEALVADADAQARRLIAGCGLEWDNACRDFHRLSRPVRTASVNQVRQPLYASSVDRSRAYAQYLAALRL